MIFRIKNTSSLSPLFSLLIGFSFISCAKEEIDLSKDDIQERYDKGMELLERRKYYRSQEH